jgi:DNA helicase-2/ATP-dependent DNA helicase PcrA
MAFNRMRADFTPSPYQEAIFEFVRHGAGHAMIEAVAGSGKSTTLLKVLDLLPQTASVAFVAFNREIARHLRGQAPQHVKVCTLHSLGYEAVRNAYGDAIALDDRKTTRIVSQLVPAGLRAREADTRRELGRLVSLAKAALVDPANPRAVAELVDRYGISLALDSMQISSLLDQALDRSLDDREVMDYDDMIYWPVRLGLRTPHFDVLLVDEAQDLNAAQIELVLRSVRPGGRVIAVGDRRQSIYGWRGADTEAIPRLIDQLGATTLPLSISYRCPRRHVELARQLAPQIEAAPDAQEGSVQTFAEEQLPEVVRPGDLIICRTNAPLVECVFRLLKRGIRAVISGKDMSSNLQSLAREARGDTLSQMLQRLEAWHDMERRRLAECEASETRFALSDDRVASLKAIMAHCHTTTDVFTTLDDLYRRRAGRVTLSTVHRAKGLEAERVVILRPDQLPLVVTRDWEKIQERNVEYVALTRSKFELVFAQPRESWGAPGDLLGCQA